MIVVFFLTEIRYYGLLNHLLFVSVLIVSGFESFESSAFFMLSSIGYGPPAVLPLHSLLIEYCDQVAGKILQRYT